MENASKALIIAGGILLAIITLSLIVYMTTATSNMAAEQDRKILTNQISAFNKEYEAYNKRKMYGTDLITVIKKAINYNGGLDANEADKFINIIFTINDDFKTIRTTITIGPDGTITERNLPINEASLQHGTYQLREVEGNTKINENIIDFFSGSANDIMGNSEKVGNTIVTKNTYSALTNFKRSIFSCTDVTYNPANGRIQSMTFVQE